MARKDFTAELAEEHWEHGELGRQDALLPLFMR